MTTITATTAFRVRRKSDGKFSTGTTRPSFTKDGKFFVSPQALHQHINWFLKGPKTWDSDGDLVPLTYTTPDPEKYEIVTYAVHEVDTCPLRTSTDRNWG